MLQHAVGESNDLGWFEDVVGVGAGRGDDKSTFLKWEDRPKAEHPLQASRGCCLPLTSQGPPGFGVLSFREFKDSASTETLFIPRSLEQAAPSLTPGQQSTVAPNPQPQNSTLSPEPQNPKPLIVIPDSSLLLAFGPVYKA